MFSKVDFFSSSENGINISKDKVNKDERETQPEPFTHQVLSFQDLCKKRFLIASTKCVLIHCSKNTSDTIIEESVQPLLGQVQSVYELLPLKDKTKKVSGTVNE